MNDLQPLLKKWVKETDIDKSPLVIPKADTQDGGLQKKAQKDGESCER